MTAPKPTPEQVRQVSQALIRNSNDARRALRRFDTAAYETAMAEVRVCRSWLDTYAPPRAA